MDRVPDGRLCVGSIRGGRVLHCTGRCTAAISDRLRAHLDQRADDNPGDLFLELGQATAIDSTFVGYLLGLVTGRSGRAKCRVVLVNPTDAVTRALSGMHVLQCFDVRSELPEQPIAWQSLESGPIETAALADLVVAAHDNLVAADERNREAFGGVVETFRRARDACKPEPPDVHPG